jgi:hypothetical protein
MPSKNPKSKSAKYRGYWILVFSFLLFAFSLTGCQEMVHMGQVSDREAGFAVNNVIIEQQQPGGQWKSLGHTDGNGRWWVMKDFIKGGGRIKLSKPGYHTKVISESEFLQEMNIVLLPTGGSGMEEDAHSLQRD